MRKWLFILADREIIIEGAETHDEALWLLQQVYPNAALASVVLS